MSDLAGIFSHGPVPPGIAQSNGLEYHPRERRDNYKADVALGGILVFTVLLAPIPVASNHPLAWLFWAIFLGLVATFRSAGTGLIRVPQSKSGRIAVGASSLFFFYSCLQALQIYLPTGTNMPPFSLTPAASFLGAIRVASYIVFFLLMISHSRRRKLSYTFARILFFGIAAHALAAMVALNLLGDTALIIEKSAYFGMATGGFGNRNAFATFLGMGLVLGLALTQNTSTHSRNRAAQFLSMLAFWTALAIILNTLIATQSRMGMAATAAASFLAFPRSASGRAKPLAALAALAIGLTAVFGQGLVERFGELQFAASTRGDLYAQVWEMIRARPILGHGLDSFPIAFEEYHKAPVTAGFVWDKAHSIYLTLWAEMGLVIGSIPIALGLIAGAKLWIKSNRNAENQQLALAALAALALAALHSLIDFSMEIEANMFLLLALIGLGLGGAGNSKGNS